MAVSYTTISRDSLLRYVSDAEFFVKNPALAGLTEELTACRDAFVQSKAGSTCGCGGNRELLTPCFTHLLDLLESFKYTNKEAISAFVAYVTNRPINPDYQSAVTIHYKRAGETDLHKYEFVA